MGLIFDSDSGRWVKTENNGANIMMSVGKRTGHLFRSPVCVVLLAWLATAGSGALRHQLLDLELRLRQHLEFLHILPLDEQLATREYIHSLWRPADVDQRDMHACVFI